MYQENRRLPEKRWYDLPKNTPQNSLSRDGRISHATCQNPTYPTHTHTLTEGTLLPGVWYTL